MPAVRVGLQVQPQHATYAQMRAWVAAEEIGADTLFTRDQFYPLYGEPDGLHIEGWTLLATTPPRSSARFCLTPIKSNAPTTTSPMALPT